MSTHIRIPDRLYQTLKAKKRDGDTFADVINRHVSDEATVWSEQELRDIARETVREELEARR